MMMILTNEHFNTLLAKNGEAIYFDFETNERIESPEGDDQWCTDSTTDVSGDDSGTRWRATYTPSVDADVWFRFRLTA